MNYLIKSFTILLCISAAIISISCNKEEETTTTSLEFQGSLNVSLPAFVLQNEKYIIKPDGLKRADSDTSSRKGYGIAVGLSTRNYVDTIRLEGSIEPVEYVVETPAEDTLGAFVVMVYGFASGYTSSYKEIDCIVVNPILNYGSITNWDYTEYDPYFIDSDGMKYYVTKNERGPVFMRYNYCGSGLGRPYADCSAMTYVFGKYFTWNEAQEACPKGWHLPSQQEVLDFCKQYGVSESTSVNDTYTNIAGKLMVNALFNAERMWEYWPKVTITNESGFAALSTGYAVINDDNYYYKGAQEYFCFWTSDEINGNGVYRYLDDEYDNLYLGTAGKDSFAMPVRCCRDN